MSRCVTMQCNNVTLHWPHINTNFAEFPALSVTHKLFQQYLISEIIFVIGRYEWLSVIYSFTYNKICPSTVHIHPSLARPRRLVVSVGGSRWSPFRLTPPQSTLSPLLTLVLKRNYFPALLSWNNWINYLVIMFYFQLYSGVSGVGYPPSFHFSLLAKQTPCSYLQSLVCAEHIVPPSSVTSTALVNNMWANNAGSQHSTPFCPSALRQHWTLDHLLPG